MRIAKYLAASCATALAVASASAWADVTPERLLNAGTDAEAGNWLMVHKTYDSNRFSPLKEINAGNVAGLHLAFAAPFGGTEPDGFGPGGVETTPLVDNGFLYLTDAWGTPYKFDLSDGKQAKLVWICDTNINKDPTLGLLLANRGLALSGKNVITALNDGRVVACDTDKGVVAWEKKVAKEPGEGFTSAPLVIGDKILVGQSYGDWATRGFVAAIKADSGDELWRFYSVPKPGDPGSETWKCDAAANPDCWKTGGGANWVTGSYDPKSKTVYWGTGNPVPMYDPEYRPGANLYTNSSLALDLGTGKLKWYFQYTPGDYHDFDEVGPQLLIDTKINGEDRKVLAHFGRNGIFYDLDRTNGSYIQSAQYVTKLTWTKGIDPKTGKPLEYDPTKSLQTYAEGTITRAGAKATVCPNIQGGTNFFPTAYNPVLGVAYGAGIEGCSDLSVKTLAPKDVKPGQIFFGGLGVNSGAQTGSVFATDVATGKQTAKHNTPYPMYGGVLATPDLVWAGSMDGTVAAYDAKTLDVKWSMNVGTSVMAGPIAFTVGGKEYVAFTGGGPGLADFGHEEIKNKPASNMLFVFTLN
jgi:alcohol dehydrogenase (cytochrome c)